MPKVEWITRDRQRFAVIPKQEYDDLVRRATPQLTGPQAEIAGWYWQGMKSYTEIAELLRCSPKTVEQEVRTLRAIFKAFGQEMPRFNHGRPRTLPVLSDIPIGDNEQNRQGP